MTRVCLLRLTAGAAIAFVVLGCDSAATIEIGAGPNVDRTIAVLRAHHVGAWKASEPVRAGEPRFEVSVLRGDLPAAVGVLRERGAPPRPSGTTSHALSLPTPAEEHQQSLALVSGELERTLLLWPGILDARVHVSVPRTTKPHERPTAEARAVVVLRIREAARPVEADIRTLVANAVSHLAPERVEVILVSAQSSTPAALVQVGPIATTPGGAEVLRSILIALLSLTAGLTLALVWLWRHRSAGKT
jgi:type III secretory pathway lipoprotein EscJ